MNSPCSDLLDPLWLVKGEVPLLVAVVTVVFCSLVKLVGFPSSLSSILMLGSLSVVPVSIFCWFLLKVRELGFVKLFGLKVDCYL